MNPPGVRLMLFLLVIACIVLAVCLAVALRSDTTEASNPPETNQVKATPQNISDPGECSSERYRTRVKVGSPVSRSAPQEEKKKEGNR